MFFKEWEILLVDDEPDVLSVSKLAMQNFEVYGLPLKIHTAGSMAEAIEFLSSRPQIHWALSVAFIDVVMENDTAGLELCQHIREGMGNRLTQLFIRTGQPGIAPERSVIDRYDINGYFTKAEATEDKLYSLVKGAVRQYLWARTAQFTISTLEQLLAKPSSQEQLAADLQQIGDEFEGALGKTADYYTEIPPSSLWIGEQLVQSNGLGETEELALRDRLNQQPGRVLNGGGDKYVRDENDNHLIKIGASTPQVYWISKTAFTPPDDIIDMFYRSVKGMAVAWPDGKGA